MTPIFGNPLPPLADQMNGALWARFIKEDGLILDYAGLDGAVLIPTPEECLAGKPNALAWWTPIENGAFFNGLYVEAMLRRFDLTGAAQDQARVRLLVKGLLKLSDVAETPGFIARGLATDGKTHHAVGSDDQTAPWFYGLWRYLQSDLPDATERAAITLRMAQVGEALEARGWLMPCEAQGDMPPGQVRGGWGSADYRAATRLLFTTRILYTLTGEKKWQGRHVEARDGKPRGKEKTRRQIVEEGMGAEFREHPGIDRNLWIFVVSQAMVRELLYLEEDPTIRAAYQKSLEDTAETALAYLSTFEKFKEEAIPLNTDWRSMEKWWKPQKSVAEAVALASQQAGVWSTPGRGAEILHMREPLSAFWIAALGQQARAQDKIKELLPRALAKYNYQRLYTSLFFLGEGAANHVASIEVAPLVKGADVVPTTPALGVYERAAGAPRCTDRFVFKDFPEDLAGSLFLAMPRGDSGKSGSGYSFETRKPLRAWLFVMDKGKPTLDPSWVDTGRRVPWDSGTGIFYDKIYTRCFEPGAVQIPAHDGGTGTLGIPHAVALVRLR